MAWIMPFVILCQGSIVGHCLWSLLSSKECCQCCSFLLSCWVQPGDKPAQQFIVLFNIKLSGGEIKWFLFTMVIFCAALAVIGFCMCGGSFTE